MRSLLLPFSYLYGAGVAVRNMFFDIGILKSSRAGIPVISVGNISAGGVGKTPFVELLAQRLLHKGRRIAILSRGYKRRGSGTVVVSDGRAVQAGADVAGDEPAQLASKLPGAVVIVDERRVRGARYAQEQFRVDLILLDDGFQHRYLRRDLDIVLLSATEILSGDRLLPAGNRREPFGALRRADLFVITRCADAEQFRDVSERLAPLLPKSIIGARTRVVAFKNAMSGFSVDLKSVSGRHVVAFSGIGHPEGFSMTLASLKVEVMKEFRFPDHHRFNREDLQSIEEAAQRSHADYLVTTEKDVARLKGFKGEADDFMKRNPLFFVEIGQEVISGERHLADALAKF